MPARRGQGRGQKEGAGRLCCGASLGGGLRERVLPAGWSTGGKGASSTRPLVPLGQALRGQLPGYRALQLPYTREASLPGGSPAGLPPRAGRRQLRTHVGNAQRERGASGPKGSSPSWLARHLEVPPTPTLPPLCLSHLGQSSTLCWEQLSGPSDFLKEFISPFYLVAGHPLGKALKDGSQTPVSSASFLHHAAHPMASFKIISCDAADI